MSHEELAREVVSVVAARVGRPEDGIRTDMNFEYDLELDSAALIGLIDAVETELDVLVSDESLSRLYRVRDLVDAVHDARVAA